MRQLQSECRRRNARPGSRARVLETFLFRAFSPFGQKMRWNNVCFPASETLQGTPKSLISSSAYTLRPRIHTHTRHRHQKHFCSTSSSVEEAAQSERLAKKNIEENSNEPNGTNESKQNGERRTWSIWMWRRYSFFLEAPRPHVEKMRSEKEMERNSTRQSSSSRWTAKPSPCKVVGEKLKNANWRKKIIPRQRGPL